MRYTLPCLFLLLLTTLPAHAHDGPRTWIGSEHGRVVTYSSDDDLEPSTYSPSRVFRQSFDSIFGISTTEFPGFEVRRDGGDVAPNTRFGFDITSQLLRFDPRSKRFASTYVLSQKPSGAVGDAPQVAITLGNQRRDTSTRPRAGFDFFNYTAEGDHAHLRFTLLGDGRNPVDGPEGIYAVTLRLTSNHLADSLPFVILLGKDVAIDSPLFESAYAVAFAEGPAGIAAYRPITPARGSDPAADPYTATGPAASSVPEPGSLATATLAAAALLARRRR